VSEKPIKVTDKRMFTPDGDLRDEYRSLADAPEAAAPAAPEPAPPPPPPAAAAAPPLGAESEPGPGPRLEIPDTGPALGAPTFFDLAAILAEPVSIYLGDVELPDGRTAENLEMARLHIDLLSLLRQKTAGNLTAQELAFLEDLLYRLRLRYVQKRG
jgi:uncharacterized protein DUF1844